MTCMDDIPEDILHYEIMKYLDFEEKIYFNQSLKPIHRKSKKIPKKNIIIHELFTIMKTFNVMMSIQDNKRSSSNYEESAKHIKKIFIYCLKSDVLKFISTFPRFKEVILDKCVEFKNPDNFRYELISKQTKNGLIYCTKLCESKIKNHIFNDYDKYIKDENNIPSKLISYL